MSVFGRILKFLTFNFDDMFQSIIFGTLIGSLKILSKHIYYIETPSIRSVSVSLSISLRQKYWYYMIQRDSFSVFFYRCDDVISFIFASILEYLGSFAIISINLLLLTLSIPLFILHFLQIFQPRSNFSLSFKNC